MKKLLYPILFIVSAAIISGCGSAPSVAIGSFASQYENDRTTYSVSEFQDVNAAADKIAYPGAAEILRSDVESRLIKHGIHVLKGDNSDVVITGIVTSFYQGAAFDRYSTVGVSITATDRKSGHVLWSASHAKTAKWHYDYNPALLAGEVTDELLNAVFASRDKH
jgi:hypothetical protein